MEADRVAQDLAEQRLQQEDGLESILADVRRSLPEKLHDTAYAAAFEVATVDLEMRMEELRVLEMIKRSLSVDICDGRHPTGREGTASHADMIAPEERHSEETHREIAQIEFGKRAVGVDFGQRIVECRREVGAVDDTARAQPE